MRFLVSFIFIVLYNYVTAQPNIVGIFDTKHGLTNSDIKALASDNNGILWIGSKEGINRYDGTLFVPLEKNNYIQLPSNHILSLTPLNGNKMAIATSKGVHIINTVTLQGESLNLPKNPNFNSDASLITNIYYNKKKGIIVATAKKALYVLDSLGKLNGSYYDDSANRRNTFVARSIHFDKDGNIIFFNQSINKMMRWVNEKSLPVVVENNHPLAILNQYFAKGYVHMSCFANSYTQAITLSNLSPTGIGGEKNIVLVYNQLTNKTDLYVIDFSTPKDKRYKYLSEAYPINDSILLLCHYFGGPMLFNTHSLKLTPWLSNGKPVFKTSWPDGIFIAPFFYNNYLWIGTHNGLLQTEWKKVKAFNNAKYVSAIKQKSLVRYVRGYEINDTLFIGTFGAGCFSCYNNKTNSIQFHKKSNKPNDVSEFFCTSMSIMNNKPYVSTYAGVFSVRNNNAFPLNHQAVISAGKNYVFTDSKQKLWLAEKNGLLKLSDNGSYQSFDFKKAYDKSKLLRISEDATGTIWALYNNSIYCINTETNAIKQVDIGVDSTIFDEINDLTANKAGKIYFCTDDNFYLFDIKTNKLKVFNKPQGLNSSIIYDIEVDNQNNAWLATDNGLSYYNYLDNSFRTYNTNTGLLGNRIFGINFCDTKCSKLFISYDTTYELKDVNQLLSNKYSSKNIFWGVKVNNQLIDHYTNTQFDYFQNDFTFEFANLDFAPHDNFKYAYFLEGYDTAWQYIGSVSNVNFKNLKPGTYRFSIKSTNANAYYTNNTASYAFVIKPAFWQKWWFFVAIAFISMFIVSIFILFAIHRIKKREEAKTKLNQEIAEVKLGALLAQMNPHFIFNCLNSIHNFILTDETEEASLYLTKFAKLVRLILDSSEKTTIPLKECIELLTRYIELEALRFDNTFEYSITIDPKLNVEDWSLPVMLLQPYIENAIWHGLLSKIGRKHLSIRFEKGDNTLICIIDDNGIGRAVAGLKKSSHKSKGMLITENMFSNLNTLAKTKASKSIIDKYDDLGKSLGTTVTVTFVKHNTNDND